MKEVCRTQKMQKIQKQYAKSNTPTAIIEAEETSINLNSATSET